MKIINLDGKIRNIEYPKTCPFRKFSAEENIWKCNYWWNEKFIECWNDENFVKTCPLKNKE